MHTHTRVFSGERLDQHQDQDLTHGANVRKSATTYLLLTSTPNPDLDLAIAATALLADQQPRLAGAVTRFLQQHDAPFGFWAHGWLLVGRQGASEDSTEAAYGRADPPPQGVDSSGIVLPKTTKIRTWTCLAVSRLPGYRGACPVDVVGMRFWRPSHILHDDTTTADPQATLQQLQQSPHRRQPWRGR